MIPRFRKTIHLERSDEQTADSETTNQLAMQPHPSIWNVFLCCAENPIVMVAVVETEHLNFYQSQYQNITKNGEWNLRLPMK